MSRIEDKVLWDGNTTTSDFEHQDLGDKAARQIDEFNANARATGLD
ncbi:MULTISPECIES: hypothetical protein [Acidiphilium]|nr:MULTISPECIES: hypothetical protein [Acidiphilium]